MLANKLAGINYNGRLLRPWLDEHYLDTGALGSDAELTSALNESRMLCLVLSPEAILSKWVAFEIDHFLAARTVESVILLFRKSCTVPQVLEGQPLIDCRADQEDAAIELLINRVCPTGEVDIHEVRRTVVSAFETMYVHDEGGFAPGPTAERDAFFNELKRYSIHHPASEGLSLEAFRKAAEGLYRMYSDDDSLYNCKMLLGDCLGAVLYRHSAYRQVMHEYLQMAEKHTEDSLLLFVIGQAYSKLTDLNIQHIDVSVVLRIAAQMDTKNSISNEEKALLVLLGRTIAKIRDTQIGGSIIKALSERGPCSRVVAIAAISITCNDSAPIFYISELENIYREHVQSGVSIQLPIPSTKLLGLLNDMELDNNPMVIHSLQLAKNDLEKAYPIIHFPYYGAWYNGKKDIIDVSYRYNAPFLGMVVLATLDNMVEMAAKADPTSIVCFTEPRIVDALFHRAGALLILEQDLESLQCQRLRSRRIPFAMMTMEMMLKLADGDFILVDHDFVISGNGETLKRMNVSGDY